MERGQPTSAPIVNSINHVVTDSDTWRLFISLLHTGATTTNSSAAAESVWERLISEPSRPDRARRLWRKGYTGFTFTSTGKLAGAEGAETAGEGKGRKQTAPCLLQPLAGH